MIFYIIGSILIFVSLIAKDSLISAFSFRDSKKVPPVLRYRVNRIQLSLKPAIYIGCTLLILGFILENLEQAVISLDWIVNRYKLIKSEVPLFLGAFTAALSGILTQVYLRHLNERKETRKHSRMLYHELNDTLFFLDEINSKIDFNVNEQSFNKMYFKGLNLNDKWRDSYSALTEYLSDDHYKKISSVYYYMKQYNDAIESENIELISNSMENIFGDDYLQNTLGHYGITTTELLEDLKSLGYNRKINRSLRHFFSELDIFYSKKAMFQTIEDEVIGLLEEKETISTKEIQDHIENLYSIKVRPGIVRKRKRIRRITYEILQESEKISVNLTECRIK